MVGMFVGALVGRLIWPVLPQRLLRENLLDLLAGIKALLRDNAHPEKIDARLERNTGCISCASTSDPLKSVSFTLVYYAFLFRLVM
jgi:hypothetical protein